MRQEDLENLDNYIFYPGGKAEEADILDVDFTQVQIKLSRNSLCGAPGQASYIEAENMHSRSGVPLQTGSKINIFIPADDLDKLLIYPQPVRPGTDELIFANLPQNVEIRIFNMQGSLVKKLDNKTNFGGIRWDLRDKNGSRARSGIYLYRIIFKSKEKIGKFVILR